VPVPDAFIADTTFDVWGSVRDEVAASFVRVFDQAALYGTNAPADWHAGGLTAPAHADVAKGADELAALDAAMAALEANGVTVDGILGGAALRSALRTKVMTTLQPFTAEPPALWGVPITYSTFWNDTVGLALVGGWGDVIAGVREDGVVHALERGRHHRRDRQGAAQRAAKRLEHPAHVLARRVASRAAARPGRHARQAARARRQHRHHEDDESGESVTLRRDMQPPAEGFGGVVTDANGRVVVNLFQQDYDTFGWWWPGPPLWIPRPVLPHGQARAAASRVLGSPT
jgi:hypothetical protein